MKGSWLNCLRVMELVLGICGLLVLLFGCVWVFYYPTLIIIFIPLAVASGFSIYYSTSDSTNKTIGQLIRAIVAMLIIFIPTFFLVMNLWY